MSERLFLGLQNNEAMLRIVGPGINASNRASRSSFSSDGDYLKVHHVIDATLNRNNNYSWGYYTFPTLGYCPIAFLSITYTGLNRVFYPNDRNPSTTEMHNYWDWIVQDGKCWVGTDFVDNSGRSYRARVIIFKNRADEYTAA